MMPIRVTLAIAAAVVALSTAALAADHDDEKGVVIADAVSLTATVKSVDAKTRIVVLEGEGGNTVSVKAGPAVKNFDQIKVGDKLDIDYVEALAVAIEKNGGAPMAAVGAAIDKAMPGEKPEVAAEETIEMKAKVVAVDKEKRTVTLVGPAGNARTIKVDKKVEKFDNLRVGDDIVARYTEAIAIEVRKPE